MKRKDIAELHTKTLEELVKLLSETRSELAKLHLDLAMKKLANTASVKEKRRDLARILTVMSMQEFKKKQSGSVAEQKKEESTKKASQRRTNKKEVK